MPPGENGHGGLVLPEGAQQTITDVHGMMGPPGKRWMVMLVPDALVPAILKYVEQVNASTRIVPRQVGRGGS